MLAEQAGHCMPVGVHALPACRHEAIIGDEVDARRAEADIGIAGANHAGADRAGHVVTRTARDRKVGAKAKAPRQLGPQRTANCSALDQIG